MHSSTLAVLAVLALAQSFVAAAPGYMYSHNYSHPSNTSWYPTGTGATHVSLPTAVVTKTKTLTWTLYIPCTTIVRGSTSYYSTASVYTTCVPEYETVTLSGVLGYSTTAVAPVYATTAAVVVAPVYATTAAVIVAPVYATTAAVIVAPVYATTVTGLLPVTCFPASTVTVIASPKTVTVTVTVTAAAVTATATATGVTAEHGICRPGTQCYSHIHDHGSWNSTVAAVSTRYYPTAVGTGR